ncbi:DNA-binding NtrC family response regulator [Roseibium hamelinense]|uniref:DNA-binding NtrC family response regulator n=1 Tax=Roseibium hamelinense TaxID=150831 RepID=A0A562SU59_9HYPH|nr:sigma-54 dependent transcriptional regulator [Roseibium hamelinense]MTI43064.1 sigma-54-dependent Fis family transcriptional regulator [Roseibium hamelinense]TWI84633.1 DNA-binding NtrC family response regulator [Roseibium hamelinense]
MKVLIVEDALSLATVYGHHLSKAGMDTAHVETGKEALAKLRKGGFSVVILDLQLPDMNGLEVLNTIREEQLPVTVVVVTSSGSIKVAVEAMQAGAYDFLVKPVAEERLITTAKNALERETLTEVVAEVQKNSISGKTQNGFVGSSLAMTAVYRMIESVARSNAAVFITGESGTGKEVCAEAIHKSSPRSKRPFVPLNCAAIPKDLIESEIFGHVKGAFTGATSDRDGAASRADGGTLFLDEICELELSLQAKLLRFLQSSTVQKVGSDTLKKADVRIVCATNRDPLEEVEAGRFREDLYYRLHVLPISLPPLRARGADILELARYFLSKFAKEEGKSFDGFSVEAEEVLLAHPWPGNVREMQNAIRNLVVLNEGPTIEVDMLGGLQMRKPAGSQLNPVQARPAESILRPTEPSEGGWPRLTLSLGQPFEVLERQIIEATIDACGGSLPKTARTLQVSPSTLYRKKEVWAAEEGDGPKD